MKTFITMTLALFSLSTFASETNTSCLISRNFASYYVSVESKNNVMDALEDKGYKFVKETPENKDSLITIELSWRAAKGEGFNYTSAEVNLSTPAGDTYRGFKDSRVLLLGSTKIPTLFKRAAKSLPDCSELRE